MWERKDDQFHLELGTAEKKGSLFLNVNKGNSKIKIFLKQNGSQHDKTESKHRAMTRNKHHRDFPNQR